MRRLYAICTAVLISLPLFATEPNPSLRQRDLAEKLLTAMKMDVNMHRVIDAMYAQIEKQYLDNARSNGNEPEDVAEAKEMFTNFRERAGRIDFGSELHEAFVRIYAKYFTEKELADLVAFYSTTTGEKTIDLMPRLMSEGMQAGLDHVTPKIEQLMKEVAEDEEHKRPWRRTMANIRTVATGVEAYAIDNEEGFPVGDYKGLKALLVPDYVSEFPEKDMWGTRYAYVVSEDRQHYRLISAGADSNFEWDSRRIVPAKEGAEPAVAYRDRLEDDLIYADGYFLQLPVQSRPPKKD